MIEQTYVFESVEVKKTGKTANRVAKLPNGKVLNTVTLVEITPVDSEMGWKKWVDEAHLFIVDINSGDKNADN